MNFENCFANRHFLVVDDEAFIRTVVGRFLKASGAANVVEAADGGAALAALADYPRAFDAVISDIHMVPVDGIELLRAIRSGRDGLKPDTPVLMLTVDAEAELVAEAMALGADAFVLKPIRREDLIERVFRVTEHVAENAPFAH